MNDFEDTLDAVIDLVIQLQGIEVDHDVDDFLKQLRHEEWLCSMGFAGPTGIAAGRRTQALIDAITALRTSLARFRKSELAGLIAMRLQQRAIEQIEET